jgi:sensor histidine kinase regulating citrate/malate metabolism
MSRVYDALRRATTRETSVPQSNVESTAVEAPKSGVSLRWKIMGTFAGLIALLGIFILVSVYYFTQRALREQLDQRASSVATTLSDAAAAHLLGRNVLELFALVRKYTTLDGVAYAFIEDTKGDIVAHTLGTFPPDLRNEAGRDRRQTERRQLKLQGDKVYEIRVPIFEGQLGAAHVGIWESSVEEQMRRALLPLFWVITIVLLIGVLLSLLLGRRVSQLIEL